MAEENKILTLFTTRMRQLILQYKEVKDKNQELLNTLESKDREIAWLKKKLEQSQNDYNSLKMARLVEMTDGDIEQSKCRLSNLIREVNKCITMLGGKED
jgi:predicted RNase H-like nuclease (RuvC/YqgF family)